MYFDDAEGIVFRPPYEADSLVFRVTIGCSHNKCTFCGMYRGVRFRIRSMEEISALIKRAARYCPHARGIFLGDGDALVLPTKNLLEIMRQLHEALPKLSRITSYSYARDILRKTPEELKALKDAGLKRLYMGIESGDDEVLIEVQKGVTAQQTIDACKKVAASGIELWNMFILGLGGKEKSQQHAINTARMLSAINPTIISSMTFMLQEGTPLREAVEKNEFHLLSPYEIIQELKQIVENIDVKVPCRFVSAHASNFLKLMGTLPQDKQEILNMIDQGLEYYKNQTTPIYNDETY